MWNLCSTRLTHRLCSPLHNSHTWRGCRWRTALWGRRAVVAVAPAAVRHWAAGSIREVLRLGSNESWMEHRRQIPRAHAQHAWWVLSSFLFSSLDWFLYLFHFGLRSYYSFLGSTLCILFTSSNISACLPVACLLCYCSSLSFQPGATFHSRLKSQVSLLLEKSQQTIRTHLHGHRIWSITQLSMVAVKMDCSKWMWIHKDTRRTFWIIPSFALLLKTSNSGYTSCSDTASMLPKQLKLQRQELEWKLLWASDEYYVCILPCLGLAQNRICNDKWNACQRTMHII